MEFKTNETPYMMKKLLTFAVIAFTTILSSCQKPNTIPDPNFDEDGRLINTPKKTFMMEDPSRVKFYVEVSGSMNGFFRRNMPTDFKIDLWDIVSYYAPIAPDITILTNTGSQGATLSQKEFQSKMNAGQFVSSASTRVPDMVETIMGNLDTDNGELAVLVSDMKYSPVGQAAPEVLLGQYTVNIRNIFAKYNKAVSLVCAVSTFYDKNGNVVASRSPYYYLIIGREEHVVKMRNSISTILERKTHFVDNIDNGLDYGAPKYSFTYYDNCVELNGVDPTFVAYDEDAGPAKLKLKIDLSDYRWRIADESFIRDGFKIKSKYGSTIQVGDIKIKAENITDKKLERKASSTIELLITNMSLDMDVLEWTMELPDTEYTLFNEFFENAWNEDDPNKSFSVENFVAGMFYGTNTNKKLETNYILISKVNP